MGSDIAVDYTEESHYSATNDVNSFSTIFEREKDQVEFNQALELINLHALIIFRTVMKYNEPSSAHTKQSVIKYEDNLQQHTD